jgi:hypothetical protein
MTDLQSLFTDAARPGAEHVTPDHVIDADIRRGHRALTISRARRGAARTAVVAVLAVGAFAVVRPTATTVPGAGIQASATAETTTGTGTIATTSLAIKLVNYTGAQPDGYTVDSVPDGWVIQGVNNQSLVIGAKGTPDQDINSFSGKLVVMLQSKDLTTLPDGVTVSVGTRPGLVSHFDADTAQLFFTDASGHKVDIQVPASLHWSDAEIAAFGASVHVSPTAVAGVG